MVKVSVLIPCYNGEKFIDRCMESIVKQNFYSLEIIVVDDGSTDNSKQKLLKWKEKLLLDSIVLKYVYQNNKGPGGAINTGLKYVDGEYLTLLDIDDVFLENSIIERSGFLDRNPDYSLVRTNGYVVEEKNHENIIRNFLFNDIEKSEDNLFELLITGKTYNWAGSYMLRTSILFQFYNGRNIYESRYGQNLQLILPVCYKRKTGYIDKPLMKYILQDNSLSQERNQSKAYYKDLRNMEGYLDIRKHMLNEIGCYEEYKKELDLLSLKSRFNLALQYKELEDARQYYRVLKECNYLSISDKISYHSSFSSLGSKIISFFYRIQLKFNSLIRNVL